MSVSNILHPIMGAAIIVPIGLAVLPFLFKNDGFRNFSKDLKTKVSLALLPAFWVFTGVWGSIFHSTFREDHTRWPDFISYPLYLILFGFILYSALLIYKNKGYRFLTICLVLVNTWFVFMMSFVAGMSISGVWL